MELKELVDIYITYAVTVCEHEGLTVSELPDPLYTAAGHGIKSRIYESYLPGFCVSGMDDHFILCSKIECYVRCMKIVVCEPFLDDILLITAADYKIIETE